ncbi:hypothetical protein GFS31_08970 [Leptolyngbya sp. BL0902]|nr:hypothetical protein GFS31_08970 [Leptolyngbya sp. BL0902]
MIEPRFCLSKIALANSVDYQVLAGPHPKSLSQAGRGTLKNFPAPLSQEGEGLGVRANPI